MSIYFKLYLLTKLDSIHGIFIFFAIGLTIAMIGISIWYYINKYEDDCDLDEKEKETKSRNLIFLKKKIRLIIPLCILFITLALLFPSKKDLIIIIAGGKTIEFVQNDTNIVKIPHMTTELLYEVFDKKINELKK